MVFWVIMGVAIGNLLLGFALAVFLNRRYQTLVFTGSLAPSSPNGFSPLTRQKAPLDEETRLGPSASTGSGQKGAAAIGTALDDLASEPILDEPSAEWSPDQEESQKTPEKSSEIEEKTESSSPPLSDTEPPPVGDGSEKVPESAEAEVPAEPGVGQENPAQPQEREEPAKSASSAEDGQQQQGEVAAATSDSPTPAASVTTSPGAVPESLSESKPPKDTPELAGEKQVRGLADIAQQEESPRRPGVVAQTPDSPEKRQGASPVSERPVSALADRSSSKASGDPLSDGSKPPLEPSVEDQTYPTGQKPVEKEATEASPSSLPIGQPPRRAQEQDEKTSAVPTEADSTPSSGLEASLERALSQWQAEAVRYFEQLSRTRAKVQKISNRPKTEEIHASLGEIHRAGQEYLTTARPARDAFSQLANLRPAMTPTKDHLHGLAAKEETLIDLTPDLLPQTTADKDSHLLCQQLLHHTDRLLDANRKVQSALEATRQGSTKATAEEGSRSRKSGNGSFLDSAVRDKVFSWWTESRPHTHRLSVIMLEVDDFERIEEDYGPSMSEGLLRAIENLLTLERQADGIAIPLSGPRFACFCPNRSMDRAVDLAEHLRQSLIATRFYRRKTDLRISVSCGVTEATRDDTPETVLERAEAAVLQARRYGKGRTFSHDGYFPMPVPAHPLAIAPKEFEI